LGPDGYRNRKCATALFRVRAKVRVRVRSTLLTCTRVEYRVSLRRA